MNVITHNIFYENGIKIKDLFLNPNYPHCSVTSFSSKIIYGPKYFVVGSGSAIMRRNEGGNF